MTELLEWVRQLLNPELLAQAGLLVLFLVVFAETGLLIGFFLPGDSLLFVAGFVASSNPELFNIYELIGALTVAAILGDQVGYLFGRRVGPALFAREESRFFKPKYIQQTQAFYERHGGKTIILGRFIPIIRTFAPIIAGVARFDYRTFVLYNIAGGIVWVTSMCVAGYFLGQIPFVQRHFEKVVIGIILVSVVPIITTWWRERQLARSQAK